MKINYYLKTRDKLQINDFVEECKKHNIPLSEYYEEDMNDFENGYTKIYGIGIFSNIPIVTDKIDNLDYTVCLLADKPAFWWGEMSNYKSFLKNFDKNKIIDYLNNNLEKCKKETSNFQLGCEMVSTIDLEYEFFRTEFHNKEYEPYILKGYCWCEVDDKWGVKTQKGYGDFKGFRNWSKDILKLNKKQLKKLYK